MNVLVWAAVAILSCMGMLSAPSEIARLSLSVYVCSMIILIVLAVKDIFGVGRGRRMFG